LINALTISHIFRHLCSKIILFYLLNQENKKLLKLCKLTRISLKNKNKIIIKNSKIIPLAEIIVQKEDTR